VPWRASAGYNPLVADDSDDQDPLWQQELARRMAEDTQGSDKGSEKGSAKGSYKGGYKGGGYKGGGYKGGGYKGQKGGGKGYQGAKGRDPSSGPKGRGGRGAAFAAAWAGWGAKGGNAAAIEPEENDNSGTWTLIALSIAMMLLGAIITSMTFRRPVARLLRRIASLIDGDTASEALGPIRAMHDDPAVAGAMPQRRGSEGTARLRGTRQDATPAEHMRTQTRWLVDSGASEDIGPSPQTSKVDRGSQSVHGMLATVGTQTRSKDFKLSSMTVYELKTRCKDGGLPTTGLKNDLIHRIEQQDENIRLWPFGDSSGRGGYASAR
jgi:hypothetical protein